MQQKRLPIGIQSFSDIRDPKKNYVYIDKTDLVYRLLDTHRYVFLSRPRRFGKSLLLDTISELYKGNKQHFEGLAIYEKWEWDETFPVINISFGSGSYSSRELIDRLFIRIFKEQNREHGLQVDFATMLDVQTALIDLITECYYKYNKKVVVLIDEYDKPILDNIAAADKQLVTEVRETMRNFYSALKDCSKYLQFVMLTGVSKFSKLNLFSGLNNIDDVSLDSRYATLVGYTQHELQSSFAEYLTGVDLEQVKRWYNGYNYLGESIYNPFDILLFLSKDCIYSNYWWKTGNPSFLVELLKSGNYYIPDLENCIVSEELLEAFDVEKISLVALLWQTGYLTFAEKLITPMGVQYRLKVPNIEVQNSLNSLFLTYLTNLSHEKIRTQNEACTHLQNKNIDGLQTQLISLFASIPYTNYVNNTISSFEGYYASVVFTFLSSLGFGVTAEDTTNTGRIDLTIKTYDAVFIIEFKVDLPTEAALHQIKSKRYYEKYLSANMPIYLIGIHFSSAVKNIESMEWELLAQ